MPHQYVATAGALGLVHCSYPARAQLDARTSCKSDRGSHADTHAVFCPRRRVSNATWRGTLFATAAQDVVLSYARSLLFCNQEQWHKWARTKARPATIPTWPDVVFKDKGWKGWSHWLSGDPETVTPGDGKAAVFAAAAPVLTPSTPVGKALAQVVDAKAGAGSTAALAAIPATAVNGVATAAAVAAVPLATAGEPGRGTAAVQLAAAAMVREAMSPLALKPAAPAVSAPVLPTVAALATSTVTVAGQTATATAVATAVAAMPTSATATSATAPAPVVHTGMGTGTRTTAATATATAATVAFTAAPPAATSFSAAATPPGFSPPTVEVTPSAFRGSPVAPLTLRDLSKAGAATATAPTAPKNLSKISPSAQGWQPKDSPA